MVKTGGKFSDVSLHVSAGVFITARDRSYSLAYPLVAKNYVHLIFIKDFVLGLPQALWQLLGNSETCQSKFAVNFQRAH